MPDFQEALARNRSQFNLFLERSQGREQAGFPFPRIDGGKIPPLETAWIRGGWWYSDRDDTLPYVQPQCRIDRAVSVLIVFEIINRGHDHNWTAYEVQLDLQFVFQLPLTFSGIHAYCGGRMLN
jgi:hypothetical protein